MRTVFHAGASLGVIAVFALALSACESPPPPVPDQMPHTSDPTPLGPGCDAQPDPHCNNMINHVVIQMLRGSHLPIVDENHGDLCRRMALDLIGRIPTPEESTWCDTATPDQMADRFMGMDTYVRQQSRAWGDHFYNLDEQWYLYVVEIDDLVNQLFRQQIRYDDFMTRLLVHPGFYERFQGDDWANNVVLYALGRPARADEVEGMRPLQRIWASRYFCDGIVWFNGLEDNGGRRMGADLNCGRTEFAVNYCRCRDDAGDPQCVSNVFGAPVDFGMDGCVDPNDVESDSNLLRVTYSAAGRVAICPNGSNLPECADRQFNDMGPETQLARLGQINGDQLNRLYGLGRALSARQDFWEAAVDREMRRFVTWWQNGLRHPDYDIPAVRTLLADELKRTGSLREIQRLIVTSLLYTQPSELPPGVAPPPPDQPQPPVWSFGPTRVLTAERWLDSAPQVAFGQQIGVCDYRFVASNVEWSRETDRRLIRPVPATPPDMSYADGYHDWAVALGGCSGSLSRTTTSTLSVVSTQNFLAQKLCANGTSVLPPMYNEGDNSPENINRGISYLYRRALSRDPSADELNAAQGDVMACIAQGGMTGCANAGVGVRWFCERLLDSAEFSIF